MTRCTGASVSACSRWTAQRAAHGECARPLMRPAARPARCAAAGKWAGQAGTARSSAAPGRPARPARRAGTPVARPPRPPGRRGARVRVGQGFCRESSRVRMRGEHSCSVPHSTWTVTLRPCPGVSAWMRCCACALRAAQPLDARLRACMHAAGSERSGLTGGAPGG